MERNELSHGVEHVLAVRRAAADLGRIYAPEALVLIDIAATWHDVGRAVDDEHHEVVGASALASEPEFAELRKQFSVSDWAQVVEAVREHRASTGNPQGVVAKIVSDADRLGNSDALPPLKRAYMYRCERGVAHAEALREAGRHIQWKFGPGGYGTRVYFPETEQLLMTRRTLILQAVSRQDWHALEWMLQYGA